MNDKSHLLRFGYAPGNYWFVCSDCGDKQAVGDKRATRCYACAETLYSQVSPVEAVADKHRGMTTLPEEAVKAAMDEIHAAGYKPDENDFLCMRSAIEVALSFLTPAARPCTCHPDDNPPVPCAGKYALSNCQSAVREMALEEAFKAGAEWCDPRRNQLVLYTTVEKAAKAYALSLSSPDHADAGKVEGDGRADLERFWRSISEADKSITFEQTFDLGDGEKMTIRNSDHYWVRDADGRVYEATWSDHKAGYWWDLEGESPVDPVEYMPHPLSLPSAPASEGGSNV